MNESSPKEAVGHAMLSMLDVLRRKIIDRSAGGGGEHILNMCSFLQSIMLGDGVPGHVTTWVPAANAMVDSRICVTVDLLNKIGIRTAYSCEDMLDAGTGVVQFVIRPDSAQAMRGLLGGLRYEEQMLPAGDRAEFMLMWVDHLRLLHRVLTRYLKEELKDPVEADNGGGLQQED